MTFGRLVTHYSYWPRQYALGFFRLWQFNGPLLALRLTLFNLFRVRRIFRIRLYEFTIDIRSGSPDLAVAIDSLGLEFEPLAGIPDFGGLIIDAGGYIGTAALRFAALFPRSRIVTIEPSVENLALLRRNVGGVANIVVIEAALAATEGEVMLSDSGNGEWGFSIVAETGGRSLGTVPTVTIDSILTHEQVDRLFLLKLDVEGAEREIFKASAGWMKRTDIVIAELHEQLAAGAEAAYAYATMGRVNRRLPGEKVMSRRE
ncbi:MAG: FkbM family methyltransferase [Devosia sp.]